MSQTKHYTIDENPTTIEKRETGKPVVKIVPIPGHDIGNGWRRQIVEVKRGETADNPASTKGPIYGPAFIVYDRAPSGITVHVHETAAEFYDAMKRFAIEQVERDLRRDGRLLGEDPILDA